MKTYNVLFAVDVPHYGSHDIQAKDDQAAIAAAEALHKADGVTYDDPSWEYAACARIVHIEAPDGKILVSDRALDNHFLRSGGEADRLLCDAAEDLLNALDAVIDWAIENEEGDPYKARIKKNIAFAKARDAQAKARGQA